MKIEPHRPGRRAKRYWLPALIFAVVYTIAALAFALYSGHISPVWLP